MTKKTGASMSVDYSNPRYRRRYAARRRAEERSWAEKSGPVKIYYRDPPLDAAVQGE